MKLIIHPRYKHLTSFLENLPQAFHSEGTVIYKERNEIKVFDTGTEKITVKSFRVPNYFNRWIYTFFRRSKARRSYEHTLLLEEKEINAPASIAYLEEKRGGLLSRSYYVSAHINYPGLLRELDFRPLEEVKDLVEAFAHFTASIHNKEVLHIDYSPGNIMYEKTDGRYHFCLVDLNRMKFGKVGLNAACFNFRRLWGYEETIAHIAKIYAEDRGFDVDKCVSLTLHYFREFWIERGAKKKKKIAKNPETTAATGQSQ
jgi:serine/threonine protein kinase